VGVDEVDEVVVEEVELVELVELVLNVDELDEDEELETEEEVVGLEAGKLDSDAGTAEDVGAGGSLDGVMEALLTGGWTTAPCMSF